MNTVDVGGIIERSRLGALQIRVLVLCGLCLIIDGYDVQVISYLAPTLIAEWGLDKADLAPVFVASLVGMAIGAISLSSLADRVGRQPVLIGALICLSICTFATAYASSVRELVILRLICGLSMGTIIPNAGALASEFSPARMRVMLVMITSSGFIIGGVAGGAVAAAMIPVFGWQSVLIVGAVAPAILAAVMFKALPESPQLLTLQRRQLDRVRALLARIDPTLQFDPQTQLVVRDERRPGVRFVHLFRHTLGTGTVLMWIANFMNLLCVYFLANWLPVLMNEAGHGVTNAVLAGTLFWVGGMAGNLLLGWFVDRRGFGATLTMTFTAAAVAIAFIGQVAGSLSLAASAIALAGFFVLGGQTALNALAAVYYPTSLRGTGMGWAISFGRLGSIVGPLAGGELLRLNWSTDRLFVAAAVPAVISLAAILWFWISGRLPVTGKVPAAPGPGP